jgi:hypothetical protein
MATDRTLAPPQQAIERARPYVSPADARSRTSASASVAAARLFTRYREAVAVVGLLTLTVLAEWPLLQGRVVAGLDSLTQFYPWYELVGAALRAGQLPGWNPHSMTGGPLAGNPLSGWAYLPAMIAFTLLPFSKAVVAYQLVHVLLATLAAYALARALGLGIAGATLAAVAYGQSGLITSEAACCFAFASVGAWLPVLLLGAEIAIRADSWRGRVRGWSLGALALSQILASWLGQGSYYALLVLGSVVLFRVLTNAPRGPLARPGRAGWMIATIGRLALHGTIPVLLGVALGAPGLLPRIELNALSSLAGGYAAEDQRVGGWSVHEFASLIEPGYWYAGLSVVGLAVLAPWPARRTVLTWYLLALGGAILVLAMPGPTPLHDLLGLLPGFARVHPHLPDRIVTVFMLVPALLAGLALDRFAKAPRIGWAIVALGIGVVFADLRAAREHTFAGYAEAEGVHRLMPVDLDAYYAPTPASRFLQERLREEGPFRYLGYGPDASDLAYTQRFSDPATVRLGVNNRAVSDRLYDLQGYDAVHLARFDQFLQVANGRDQNYHNADFFAPSLRSPLLDLLAARYVVTPSGGDTVAGDTPLNEPRFSTAYDDGQTHVLRNEQAMPWAWVVHEARSASQAEALDLLDRGEVDPRRTVLLEPPLRSPLAPAELLRLVVGTPADEMDDLSDSSVVDLTGAANVGPGNVATVVAYAADRLIVRTQTADDGVLVLSEVAYPGWVATVDGVSAPIYVANGLLRAVPLPAGAHLVELRFESPTLRLGVVVSQTIVALLVGCCAASLVVSGRNQPLP